MTTLEVANYLYKQLTQAGVTSAGACAILGNIEAESAFKPNNVEDSYKQWTDESYTQQVDSGQYTNFVHDSIGYGLAQWTYHTRKKKLLDFIKASNKSIADLERQTAFLIKEFKEDFSSIWQQLCSSNDLSSLTSTLLDKWENPTIKNYQERYRYALKWQSKMAQGGATKVTQNEAVEKVLSLARSEVGYHEKANKNNLDDKTANSGSGNYTKYGRDLDNIPNFYNGKKNGYAWCDQFVDWLFYKCFGADVAMKMLCQPAYSAGAGCMYSAQYYKNNSKWTQVPQPGDQIFFYDGAGAINHTGIVEDVNSSVVTTIEGNSSDQVQRRTYSIDSGYIAGYGRPKWELAANASPIDPIPTPTPTDNTTILRFGSKGVQVKEMQTKLIKLGYDLGSSGADGDFGIKTLIAVRKFQAEHGLAIDGEVGPQTIRVLDNAIAVQNDNNENNPTPITPVTIKVGDIVTFTGTKHYLSAGSTIAIPCKPGEAKVTAIYNFNSVKHPYHLVKTANGGSTVYGWVDAADIQK